MNILHEKHYSVYDKKIIANKMERLKNTQDYIDLLKIIKNANVKYTQNNNGLFINLSTLPNSILSKIEEYLDDKLNEYSLSESETYLTIDSLSFNSDNDIMTYLKSNKRSLTNKEKNILKISHLQDKLNSTNQ